jgi:hypothetical protein
LYFVGLLSEIRIPLSFNQINVMIVHSTKQFSKWLCYQYLNQNKHCLCFITGALQETEMKKNTNLQSFSQNKRLQFTHSTTYGIKNYSYKILRRNMVPTYGIWLWCIISNHICTHHFCAPLIQKQHRQSHTNSTT